MGTGCLHGLLFRVKHPKDHYRNQLGENSCWCEKSPEETEGVLGCTSSCQKNKDVIKYLILPHAWGVTLFTFASLGLPLKVDSCTHSHIFIKG